MTADARIRVPVLARVEGEGALDLDIEAGRVSTVRLRLFEPPRYFEQLVLGHSCDEVVDMVARICGICPVAYQLTAVRAFERILGVDPGPWVRAMRRVLYCGEWLQSHALHVHLLAAPDFCGTDSVLGLARRFPDAVRRGLRLQGLGNDLIALFGGRSVHPVGVRVGGFHRAPEASAVAPFLPRLAEAVAEAEALIDWVAALPLPEDRQDFTSVALSSADHYAVDTGDICSDDGLCCSDAAWDQHFVESQVPHSTALHALLNGRPYLVGPLARLNLNHTHLPERAAAALARTGVAWPSRNMFHSVVARAVEILAALLEAQRLLAGYRKPRAVAAGWQPIAGAAAAATEAPRGLLWHRYALDERGRVAEARIVPPTSQNQARCEADLRVSLAAFGLDRDEQALRLHAETVIRNYDPCISCATHFLKLRTRRL